MSNTTSIIASLNFASQQVTISLSIPMFIAGVLGGILNLIVFLSLQTFRESSCAFYLIVDWTQTSLFYCKFRWFSIQTCTLTSYACLCFATVDQYLVTRAFGSTLERCFVRLRTVSIWHITSTFICWSYRVFYQCWSRCCLARWLIETSHWFDEN